MAADNLTLTLMFVENDKAAEVFATVRGLSKNNKQSTVILPAFAEDFGDEFRGISDLESLRKFLAAL